MNSKTKPQAAPQSRGLGVPRGFHRLAPPRNLTDELVIRLTEEITSGRLKPNDRLPTEQEMIESFGVSRTVVREALAALRAEGLVQTRQGAGVFVAGDMRRRPFRIDPAELQTPIGVVELMELRMSVEIEAAGLAAQRRTPVDLKEISAALDAFDAAVGRGEAAIDADFAFHRAICRATGNAHFPAFLEFLGRHIIPRQSLRIEVTTPAQQERYLRKVQAEHRAIHRAIVAGNAAAARRAMRSHLSKGHERYRKLAAEHGTG